MPRADTAMRIQRTPALKYIGESLVGERQLLTPSFLPGNSPFLPAEVGWKGSPWLSPAPCMGSHALLPPQESKHTYPKGLGEAPALSSTCVAAPALYPCSHYALETRLSHAGTLKHPRALSFPKAHYVPKYNPPGVTMYSPEYCCE